MANDSEVRCKEVDAWLALRQQSNFTLAAFKQAYADGGGVSFSRAVLALQQDHEALWEMNRRKGNSSIVFKKAMRKMYDETDRAVIRRLAAAHGRPEEDFRFYQAGNLCDEDFIDPGRAVTYQVRARPGERVPGKKAGTFGKIELVVVNEGDTAWVDLPEKDVMPVYLDAFYHACGGDKWSPDMSPEAFAEAMGQYFGDRLPVEYLKEGE
ncbi:MAG: hypothetical protein JJU05_03985 [Verrucomicrobia bacterium]|nr:hypothetical protein [Verrucomicrobiota bacterium]MCH8526435.1 hypothetical protein [Kiritimatiellia bacterium]